MAFWGLQLETRDLNGLADFYANRLGFTLLDQNPERLDLRVGQTKLCFVPAEGDAQPAYEFSLNLSQGSHAQTLLDPAGNRIEITADAGLSDGVVRFSLPVEGVATVAQYLRGELQPPPPLDSAGEPGTWLVGDEDWSFLLEEADHAKANFVIATVPGDIISELKVLEYPYFIHRWHK
ncbi:MAG: hypothetical protein IT320_00415 [Anaerolineae bacterium]|nr:hypothetical protein [Anaerolineae bacterium]